MSAEVNGFEQEPEKTQKWNARRLIYQRKKSKLTLVRLSEIIGISKKQMECIENCTRIPSADMLEALASFFDVPEDYFGMEALDGRLKIKPSKLSPQDERQEAAKAKLEEQRHTLRKMMKIAGFPINCTGLHFLSEAIDESIADTCQFVNGELIMPPAAARKVREWFATVPKANV